MALAPLAAVPAEARGQLELQARVRVPGGWDATLHHMLLSLEAKHASLQLHPLLLLLLLQARCAATRTPSSGLCSFSCVSHQPAKKPCFAAGCQRPTRSEAYRNAQICHLAPPATPLLLRHRCQWRRRSCPPGGAWGLGCCAQRLQRLTAHSMPPIQPCWAAAACARSPLSQHCHVTDQQGTTSPLSHKAFFLPALPQQVRRPMCTRDDLRPNGYKYQCVFNRQPQRCDCPGGPNDCKTGTPGNKVRRLGDSADWQDWSVAVFHPRIGHSCSDVAASFALTGAPCFRPRTPMQYCLAEPSACTKGATGCASGACGCVLPEQCVVGLSDPLFDSCQLPVCSGSKVGSACSASCRCPQYTECNNNRCKVRGPSNRTRSGAGCVHAAARARALPARGQALCRRCSSKPIVAPQLMVSSFAGYV